MLTQEENDLLTRVGRGTPMGDLIREYWIPAFMASELSGPDGDPLRIRLLGENLIAFQSTSGKIGLVANNCPHRGASLFYGRNEDEGIRCVYQGLEVRYRRPVRRHARRASRQQIQERNSAALLPM